jgi:hypothetical protein
VLPGEDRLGVAGNECGKRDDPLDRPATPRVEVEEGVHDVQLDRLQARLLAQLAQRGEVRCLPRLNPA